MVEIGLLITNSLQIILMENLGFLLTKKDDTKLLKEYIKNLYKAFKDKVCGMKRPIVYAVYAGLVKW